MNQEDFRRHFSKIDKNVLAGQNEQHRPKNDIEEWKFFLIQTGKTLSYKNSDTKLETLWKFCGQGRSWAPPWGGG